MAVTKSWEQRTIVRIGPWKKAVPAERRHELPWLAGASLMVCAGIVLALLGKTANFREITGANFRFELYASGEYTKMLENEWGTA